MFVFSSHITYKRCIETKECSFFSWSSLDAQFGSTDHNDRYIVAQFLSLYKRFVKSFLRGKTEVINLEALSVTYYECVSVLFTSPPAMQNVSFLRRIMF